METLRSRHSEIGGTADKGFLFVGLHRSLGDVGLIEGTGGVGGVVIVAHLMEGRCMIRLSDY